MSMGITAAVTVPRALPVNAPVSYVAMIGVNCRNRLRDREGKFMEPDRPAGRPERPGHVLDARVIPWSRGARAAVRGCDPLECSLVFSDALDADALEQLVGGYSSGCRTPPAAAHRQPA